jgi:DNA mismatch repair protein MutL
MSDIIRLLPESVANQIAAGEVVQRPASAVKELLENAIDAGSREIRLIIRESGKTLIRVADNGCGLSERDARMCFERHATSKIKSADDLGAIRTLGFRGEALASIASIAHVELKSRKTGEEVGTCVEVQGSGFVSQTPVSTPEGTDISVKNLFYNVPARRNFLKSNTLELKYIIEEFFRVALVNPDINFTFHNNDKLLYHLPPSNLKQRIVNLFGDPYGQRLIPVHQESGLVNITGFIGKPEFAKKTRGEQYFFTNGRFIRNPYLNHSVENAFRELIPNEAYPTYFLYLEVEPQNIDVNIHPTKTEINFLDAKSIYAILNSAVKQSIGRFNLSASLDFETEKGFEVPPPGKDTVIRQPVITVNPDYNPFEKQTRPQLEIPYAGGPQGREQAWQKLLDPLKDFRPGTERSQPVPEPSVFPAHSDDDFSHEKPALTQMHNQYIMVQKPEGILMVNQQNAHERILYERFLNQLASKQPVSQRLLIPVTVSVGPDEAPLLKELVAPLGEMGLEVSGFGGHSYLVHSLPQGMREADVAGVIESLLEDFKKETSQYRHDLNTRLARTLALRLAVKAGKRLQQEEMTSIVEALFACQAPEASPDGKPTMILLSMDDLSRKFKT